MCIRSEPSPLLPSLYPTRLGVSWACPPRTQRSGDPGKGSDRPFYVGLVSSASGKSVASKPVRGVIAPCPADNHCPDTFALGQHPVLSATLTSHAVISRVPRILEIRSSSPDTCRMPVALRSGRGAAGQSMGSALFETRDVCQSIGVSRDVAPQAPSQTSFFFYLGRRLTGVGLLQWNAEYKEGENRGRTGHMLA